nr:MAG TPA: hypothetical protein [Caudoviricetes sp.]
MGTQNLLIFQSLIETIKIISVARYTPILILLFHGLQY